MPYKTPVPRLGGFDHTLAFLREGYNFIGRRCERLESERFLTRIMLSPVLCMRGAEAAEIFYGQNRFTRQGALPPTTLRLLQDKGSVQQLDGQAHRYRKSLFVELLMSADAEGGLLELFREEWRRARDSWSRRQQIVLYDEANLVITRSICRWTGIPLEGKSAEEMTAELASMVENAGSVSPGVLLALARRRRTEGYLEELVRNIRKGQAPVAAEAPAARIAFFRDTEGKLLSESAAAVEILNILRPTLAVGRYIVFVAFALKEYPQWRSKLKGAGDEDYDFFAEEVRRLYPFFPVVGGLATETFEWRGHSIDKDDWVLLDLHGTNHHPRLFEAPYDFKPERRLSWRDQSYDFIPQGAGQAPHTHRCPGEQFTVALMREAARMLIEEMDYELPRQDFSVAFNRMPTMPKSGMILANITSKAA